MEGQRPITVAVIGCGEIAQIMHLPHLRELNERFRLSAVCDTDPEVLKSVGRRFSVERLYTDAAVIFDDPSIDSVVIATPGDHASLVRNALDAGKHVLVEKPLCYSVDDALWIAEQAHGKGLTVMVGYSRLFDTAFDDFRELAGSEAPGRFITATAILPDDSFYRAHHDVTRCAAPAADSTTTAPPNASYLFEEVLHNLATHELYCLRRLSRADVRLVSAEPLLGWRGVRALWRSADGDDVSLTLAVMTGLSGGYREEFLVATAESHISLAYPSVYLRNTPATVRHVFARTPLGPLRAYTHEGSYTDPFKRELDHFADVLTGRSTCLCDAADAVHDVAAVAEVFAMCDQNEDQHV